MIDITVKGVVTVFKDMFRNYRRYCQRGIDYVQGYAHELKGIQQCTRI